MSTTIAITTPTGNVGRRITAELVRRSEEHDVRLVLLARDADRVSEHVGPTVRVEQGRLEEPGYLRRATRGVDALYLATPNGFPDGVPVRAGYRRIAEEAARAIRENRIRHTVHLSGFVTVDDGAGSGSMLRGLADTEEILDRAVAAFDEPGPAVTHLRAGFFFENFLGQIDTIESSGHVFLPVSASVRVPMVASRDVAAVAIETLLAAPPDGVAVRSVLGPADLSFHEAAAAMSSGLGKRVRMVRLPRALIRLGMLRRGRSKRMTDAMLAIFRAAGKEGLRAEPGRDASSTTPTTMEQFAREELRPLVERQAEAGPLCPARVQ